MRALAKSDAEGEVAGAARGDLAHDGDIAIERGAEFPVHAEVLFEILPAVAGTHKSAAGAGETAAAGHGQRHAVAPGDDAALAGHIDDARAVVSASSFEVRGEQSVDPDAGEKLRIALQFHVHEDDGIV